MEELYFIKVENENIYIHYNDKFYLDFGFIGACGFPKDEALNIIQENDDIVLVLEQYNPSKHSS